MTDEIGMLWEKVLESTKEMLPHALWEQCIHSGLLPISIDDNTFTLMATREYIKNIIEKTPLLRQTLRNAISANSNRELTLKISTLGQENGDMSTIIPPEQDPVPTATVPAAAASTTVATTTATAEPVMAASTSSVSTNAVPAGFTPANNTNVVTPEVILPSHSEPLQPTYPAFGDYIDTTPPSPSDIEFVDKQYLDETYDEPVIIDKKSIIPQTMPTYDDPVIMDAPAQENLFEGKEKTGVLQTPTPIWIKNPTLYTFDNFIQGGSNRVAYSVSMKVAEEPGCKYNPLFIYGDPGLGKTHLMIAIASMAQQRNKDMKILCMTSEDFLNAFVNSIKNNKNEEFRNTFRNVDMLLIDDIQFLQDSKYKTTGVEFFNTFNVLYDKKAQIVVTSDMKPEDLKEMEQRMRSRFQQGMVVEIGKPDLETRLSILYKMLEDHRISDPDVLIPDEVIRYIASTFTENIRMLQGAFTKLMASTSIDNCKHTMTLEYARHVLSDIEPPDHQAFITMDIIIDCILNYYHIKKDQLMSKKRSKQYSNPRQVAMYLCRELLTVSYPQIAETFKRDHTTVMHAYEKIAKEMEKPKAQSSLKQDIEQLIEKINKVCG